MKDSGFKNYSLVLIEKEKVIFKSKKESLRPLVECINKFKSKVENCILYDKVIGLAAAKLIVYSGIISEAVTPLCSKGAKDFLIRNKIKIKAEKIVENILRKDKKGICPMEIKARNSEAEELIAEISKSFKCG